MSRRKKAGRARRGYSFLWFTLLGTRGQAALAFSLGHFSFPLSGGSLGEGERGAPLGSFRSGTGIGHVISRRWQAAAMALRAACSSKEIQNHTHTPLVVLSPWVFSINRRQRHSPIITRKPLLSEC